MISELETKKENQRVRLTKRMLREGLIHLLRQKELHQITVTELCSYAEINRTTFYKYYGNVYDVLNDIETEFKHQWDIFVNNVSSTEQSAIEKSLINLLYYIKNSREIYSVLLKNKTGQSFLSEMVQNTIDFLRKDFDSDDPQTSSRNEYIFQYIVSGSAVIIQKWIESGTLESAEFISTLLYELAISLLTK